MRYGSNISEGRRFRQATFALGAQGHAWIELLAWLPAFGSPPPPARRSKSSVVTPVVGVPLRIAAKDFGRRTC